MPEATEKQWYLIQCKPRQDMRALEHLERQGYQCLSPKCQVERLQKGKLQLLNEPLFPGYLFIYLDRIEDNWLPIRSTRGVNQIVSFGELPTPIPNKIINQLLQRDMAIAPALMAGDRVRINDSNFQGIEAIFLARDGAERILVLLTLLQREIVTSISLNQIKI
ncbi:transcription/translation regulatory transformer protein RfaH [Pseudomonas citronellolis]|uniref:transcription/translation regulatory transformer protein RfaH n=1 Tax=Pseudomonas citronellolis TaxID=53408 RepID=UPI000853B7AB|nr:transcription/translation regulatory transformer protein RfaH [Pseudomonas humi]